MMKKWILAVVAVAAFATQNQARASVIGVGISFGPYHPRPWCGPYYGPYYRPYPAVYVAPAPVYYAPPPVYVTQPPVYVQPSPVVQTTPAPPPPPPVFRGTSGYQEVQASQPADA